MDGSIAVKDVPTVWASKMKELLGVDVPGDAEGCLQDIHWWAASRTFCCLHLWKLLGISLFGGGRLRILFAVDVVFVSMV